MNMRRSFGTALAMGVLLAAAGGGAVRAGQPVADLGVTKTDSPDPAVIGQQVTYTVTVTNQGPATASPVMRDLPPPADAFVFVSATPSQGSCDRPFFNAIVCSLGTISPGGSATVTIIFTAIGAGSFNNWAIVEDPNIFDDNAANDRDIEPMIVDAATPPPSSSPIPSPTPGATATPLAALLPNTTATAGLDASIAALVGMLVLAGAVLVGAWGSARRRASRPD